MWTALLLPLLLSPLCAALESIPLQYRAYSAAEAEHTLSFLQLSSSQQLQELSSSKPLLPQLQLTSRFYGTFGVGTPRQDFEVVYDTGSDVAWVYNEDCHNCDGRQKFRAESSSTFTDRQRPFTIRYGTGETGGPTAEETVHIGSLEVQKQVVGFVKETDEKLQGFAFSGVVGLSYPMENEPAGFAPVVDGAFKQRFEQLEREHQGKLPLHHSFSFFLAKRPEQDGSFMFIGATEEMNHADDIQWVSTLQNNQYWEIPFESITLLKTTKGEDGLERQQETQLKNKCQPCSSGVCKGADVLKGCIASVDTGHSLISGPPDFIDELNTHITVQSECTEASVGNLPKLRINFEGFSLEMEGKDYIVSSADSCQPGWRSRDPHNGHGFIFGEHFMRSYYTVFDREANRVGLARSPQEAHPLGVQINHLHAGRRQTSAERDSFDVAHLEWFNDIPEATVLQREPHNPSTTITNEAGSKAHKPASKLLATHRRHKTASGTAGRHKYSWGF